MSEPLVLGIESSCDETGVGIVRGRELLAHEVASSVDEHVRFGGVVPEVASRAHLEALTPTLRRACTHAGVAVDDVDGIAVTAGPGLAGSLLVGVAGAKALALAHAKPLYGLNHLAAHVAADQLEHGPFSEPVIVLLVSGGHTELLLVEDIATRVELLGSTIDDAAGEAYDKVARLLGLGYPGGPVIDRHAAGGDPEAIAFPRALTPQTLAGPDDRKRYRWDFSFSGVKSAVARYIDRERSAGRELAVDDVAASFQDAVCDVLTAKALDACRGKGVSTLVIAGGVAANGRLRAFAEQRAEQSEVTVRVPRPGLCTDNGAMVAALGAEAMRAGMASSPDDLGADSSLPVTTIAVQ